MRTVNVSLVLAVGLVGGCLGSDSDEAAQISIARLRGAIFTTLKDGVAVNHNIYNAKEDVYLDGGPSENAPPHAASLPPGDYYFQVTDPSGKTLLSTDAITCRRFTVSGGVIVSVRASGGCAHMTGIDSEDYATLGAITVQLMPYDDTPNPGGVYKVWVTPILKYVEGGESRFHGFLPSESKTDNFKIRIVAAPPPICGDGKVNQDSETCDGESYCREDCTFCGDSIKNDGEECDAGPNGSDSCTKDCKLIPPPCCGDGHLDAGEECDDGNTTDGDGCSATCTKEVTCPAPLDGGA